MIEEDFDTYPNFSLLEFYETGGDIERMKKEVFDNIQVLRSELGVRIDLLSTTGGRHEPNSRHYKGEAVDIYIHGAFRDDYLLETFLNAGFRGVGFYKNAGGVNSYHLDIRRKFTFWRGVKRVGENRWRYSDLVVF